VAMSRGHINEEEKNDRFDARKASMDADLAEAYALDAIDFAQGAVDEAGEHAPSTIKMSRTVSRHQRR
jgi:cell division septation protein DedD